LGRIDAWINNAGTNGYRNAPLWEGDDSTTKSIVATNLLGTLYCSKYAYLAMRDQGSGHIFAFDGYGANGMPSPRLAAYGASKRGLPQLSKTLAVEAKGSGIGFHTLSPGMVLTELLLREAGANVRVFAILADPAPKVAAFLARKVLSLRAGATGKYYRWLTMPKAFLRFLAAPWRIRRYGRMVEEAARSSGGPA
jgi:chlorophyll(ide) b reductase